MHEGCSLVAYAVLVDDSVVAGHVHMCIWLCRVNVLFAHSKALATRLHVLPSRSKQAYSTRANAANVHVSFQTCNNKTYRGTLDD
jgi:hypothetical protein